MADAENAVDMNLTSVIETSSSLIEQLGKAFAELQAHKAASTGKVRWNHVEGHFRNVESVMKKKLDELEAKENELRERESHNSTLLAEREAAVIAKEQDLLDRVQELKDAAVAAIVEAKATHQPATVGDTNGNKVSSSFDDENASPEGKSPSKSGENAEGVTVEVNPSKELTQICEQMDSKGLVKYVMENLKDLPAACKQQLAVALGSATQPAQLVLDALEGFFPPTNETTQERENRDDAAIRGLRQSCLLLMEGLSALLSKADSSATDDYLNPEIKQQAMSIAHEWKPKLAVDAANGNSLEAEGFLRLLATFRIASSEFDEEELCKYVLAVTHHRQATELCHSLELTQKIPGLVETLINSGRQIDAVHFIQAFQLSEAFPPVPLLKAYLKELRRNSQGNGTAAVQNDYNARELAALIGVIGCVEEYKLEDEYPLAPLRRRVAQLDKSSKGDKPANAKRTVETANKPPQQQLPQKKPRTDGGFHGNRARGPGAGRLGPQPVGQRAGYNAGLLERYVPPVPSAYSSYPVSSHSIYGSQGSDQRSSYYYAEDDRARGGLYSAVAPPNYSAYSHISRQPYK